MALWYLSDLDRNHGGDKASYAITVVPVVALTISTFTEGYVWTIPVMGD
ncbi:hypothetical protein [Desulfobacter postgatei]|nr:hypothetical protein [uncultured Desulfobacter sp.]